MEGMNMNRFFGEVKGNRGILFHDKADVLDRIISKYSQIEVVQTFHGVPLPHGAMSAKSFYKYNEVLL